MESKEPEQVLEELRASIGANVRRAREARSLKAPFTQAALAKAIDCEVNYVQKLERGKATPSLKLLARLAVALNMSVRDLVRPTQPLSRGKLGRPRTRPERE